MSGTFPSSPVFESLKITSYSPTLTSVSHNLMRQVRTRGSHQWYIEGVFPEGLSRAQWAPMYAFLVAQRGQYETFQFTPPYLDDTSGTPLGTPVVDGADQTGRTVDTTGWTPLSTDLLKAGDFIRFNSMKKVYMVTEDVDSDADGDATISIEPSLRVSPVNSDAIVYNNVDFTVALTNDKQVFSLEAPTLFSLEVSMIEVIDPNG